MGGRGRATRDLGTIAEIAGAAKTVADYERELFTLLDARVGFDVAMMKRRSGPGPVAPGFDPGVLARTQARWPQYAAETRSLSDAARASRGVVVDVEVLGRRLERLDYYQDLMRPHCGRSTALVYVRRAGVQIAGVVIGRCTPRFRAAEIEYLETIAPTLALCEVTVTTAPPVRRDQSVDGSALTPRELEVLGYLHLGYTNEEIGRALGTAPRTVRNQLSEAYRKLGVANRTEAAHAALALGLGRASRSG